MAKSFLRVFDETADYANLKSSDSLSPSSNELAETQLEQPIEHKQPTTRLRLVEGEPFRLTIESERVSGSFDLTNAEDADKLVERINALKAFLKPSAPCRRTGGSTTGLSATGAWAEPLPVMAVNVSQTAKGP